MYDGLVIVWKRANNPRQKDTQGSRNWPLYKVGMTYAEYRASPYDNTLPTFPPNGRPPAHFKGPRADHWKWDMERDYIKLGPRP